MVRPLALGLSLPHRPGRPDTSNELAAPGFRDEGPRERAKYEVAARVGVRQREAGRRRQRSDREWSGGAGNTAEIVREPLRRRVDRGLIDLRGNAAEAAEEPRAEERHERPEE